MREQVELRDVEEGDLPVFLEHQQDPVANQMAAFPARERDAFMAHWRKILVDDGVVKQTILLNGEVVGNVLCFEQPGKHLIGYWLGRKFWGRGIASQAVSVFVSRIPVRPLHAHVAKNNLASRRVLEKCGFEISGESHAAAAAGSKAVDEFVYSLFRSTSTNPSHDCSEDFMISIRPETPDDFEAIHRVTLDAFSRCELGHNGEAELIDLLRENSQPVLSLVAQTAATEVIGHVLFTPVSAVRSGRRLDGRGLAPMAVAPAYQKSGVGSLLVRNGLNHLSEHGCPFVVVLGHVEYYSRFGFESASHYGASHGFAGIPQNLFLIKLLTPDAMPTVTNSTIYYAREFGPQHDYE